MSALNFSLHVDVSPSIFVRSPNIRRDTKNQLSEDVVEAIVEKDLENVKRKGKGKGKTLADGSGDENLRKKLTTTVESQDIPWESIPETVPNIAPATPDDLINTMVTYFVFMKLNFRLGEFALVTGLKCKGGTSVSVKSLLNKLVKKYFKGSANVTLAQLEDYFINTTWRSDDDAVKIAILYFVNTFLFASLKTKYIDMARLYLVESGEFNTYPWAIDVFNVTVKLRNIFTTDDERMVLDLEGLTFETATEASQSQRMSDGFLYTQVPKGDMGQSSHGDNEFSNADMKKEFDSFWLQVDSNFREILQAIGDLAKKVDEKTTITQAAKVGASSTKGEEDEQATKDVTLETINVNAGVNEQAREDWLPQGGDVVAEGDVALGAQNVVTESVVPPPPEDDIMHPHAGQVAEDIVRAEYVPMAEEVPANATV
ncbi:hypothetical protein RND71_034619 [Anisodus tanguticus]|uniref:DUF1985 domain-containing protein n=1 Tax=Anisodus tanguticus TaxID=243964 RepID=A0AAE1V568_9SOLA|nr:hypothetical protein RND71_034619 [Anisodus tanguticus]